MRSSTGQATVDYVVVVLLVAVALGGAAAVVSGDAVAGAVRHGFARALCRVGGGSCEDRPPCVVSARVRGDEHGLRVKFLVLGGDRALVREQRSDGTEAITLLEGSAGTLAGPGGNGPRVWIGHGSIGLGGAPVAGVLGRVSHSRTWVVPRARADAFVLRLTGRARVLPQDARPVPDADRLPPGPALEPPVSETHEAAVAAVVGGRIGERLRALGLPVAAEDVEGVSTERTTGRRTLLVRRRKGAPSLAAAGASLPAGAEERMGLTVDRDGRPLELSVVHTGPLRGSGDLPALAQPAAGLLTAAAPGERGYVVDGHLDLTVPSALVAARGFLDAVAHERPGPAAALRAAREVLDLLERDGVVHARAYARDERRYGFRLGGRAGGVRATGTFAKTFTTSRLIAAASRGLDGAWTVRDDCLGVGPRA